MQKLFNNLQISLLMIKIILLAFLLVAASARKEYFLSPTYPPSAYQNQFYTTRFRVRGLNNPVFSFEGLPKDFRGSSDGVIFGVSSEIGSFPIVINYRQDSQSGSSQAILKVLSSGKKIQNIAPTVPVSDGLIIQNSKNLIFVQGQPIKIQFTVKNSQGNIVWVFNELPNGINGNPEQGVIEGSINDAGYYSFHVQCGDSRGKSAQAFITINVQPKNSLKTTQIVDVPKEDSQNSYFFDLIEKQQIAADNELYKVLENANSKKAAVATIKQNYAVARLKVQKAQASYNAVEAGNKKAQKDRENAIDIQRNALKSLQAIQDNVELSLTEGNQSGSFAAGQREKVDNARKRLDNAQKSLQNATNDVNKAKQNLKKCEKELRDALSNKKTTGQEYKRANDALQDARQALQNAKRKKQNADNAVKSAKDSLELANLARDNAESNFKQANFNLERAEKDLKDALKKAAELRNVYKSSSKNANSSTWELELAINKLYVAQSRKQTADRASAFALAEGSLSDHNGGAGLSTIGSTSATFGGCDSKNYPIATGTSQVVSVNQNGYRLSSGQQIIYGPCSQVTACKVGDFVNYNGYFLNGVINANRINTVLLS